MPTVEYESKTGTIDSTTIDFTKEYALPCSPAEIESFTLSVKNPFVIEGQDGSWTFCRKPLDAAEENLKLRILAHSFADLFQGNTAAHYKLQDGEYAEVDGAPTETVRNFFDA